MDLDEFGGDSPPDDTEIPVAELNESGNNEPPVQPPATASPFGLIRPIDIDKEMRTAYLDYAMSVIVARALPDSRDGLKPVQRRILYVMHDSGARASAPYRKSARVVGDVLGKYHPHGDQSVYDAMVRMAQDFSQRYLLVDGQGNFGSVDGDPPAAMRYTEVRLSRVAEELLTDLERDTVDWQDNYDGTTQEPTVLPSALPNLLLNGASGIAVGMATNIPPHNLGELCDGIVYLIDAWKPDTGFDEGSPERLMELIPGPDFPTGGQIIGREGIHSAYATGRGRVVMRGVAEVEEMPRSKGERFQIVLTELPYQVNKSMLIERIAELVRDERIEGITDIRDESDRTGMRAVIELRRGAQPNRVLNRLYKYSALQSTFGVQTLALVDGQPRLLGLKKALTIFIDHRREVIRRRSEWELARARARAHILEGLRIAIQFLDEVIRIIRTAESAEAAKSALMTRFGLSDVQTQAILDLQLRRLAALERQRLEDEYAEVMKTIAYLLDLLAHAEKMLALIREDILRLREKYADARRTKIILDERESFDEEELIQDKVVLVSLTQRGYIKQTPLEQYKAQARGGRGVSGMATKEQDEIMYLFSARTHDTVLFFTNKGRVYAVRAYQLPEANRDAKGVFLSNIISLMEGERVTAAISIPKATMAAAAASHADDSDTADAPADPVEDVTLPIDTADEGLVSVEDDLPDSDSILVTDQDEPALAVDSSPEVSHPVESRPTIAMCTTRGKIKRVALSAFSNIRQSGLLAMSIADGDDLNYVRLTSGAGEVLIVTAQGQALRFDETLVRLMGRTASGVRAMKLKKEGDYIAGMETVEPNGYLLVVTEKGFGKCTELSEYGSKGRGGSGMRTMTGALDVTGRLVAARVVHDSEQITVMSAAGTVLRAHVKDIPKSGRAARGSRLINLRDTDVVAAVARLQEQ